jgi:hypothetical protein
VERCRAWRCGLGRTKRTPVAIWYAWTSDSVIQDCEAWDNHPSGGSADGGGFDLDGGCTRCVLQNNYSHHNEGAGYLLCTWDPGEWPTRGSLCRYNLSVDDGLSNGYSGIVVWQAEDSRVYYNTSVSFGTSPLRFMQQGKGNQFSHNVFAELSGEPVAMLKSDYDVRGNRFQDNLFWSSTGHASFNLPDQTFGSLPDFEAWSGGKGDRFVDPQFVDPKAGNYRSRLSGYGYAKAAP